MGSPPSSCTITKNFNGFGETLTLTIVQLCFDTRPDMTPLLDGAEIVRQNRSRLVIAKQESVEMKLQVLQFFCTGVRCASFLAVCSFLFLFLGPCHEQGGQCCLVGALVQAAT